MLIEWKCKEYFGFTFRSTMEIIQQLADDKDLETVENIIVTQIVKRLQKIIDTESNNVFIGLTNTIE